MTSAFETSAEKTVKMKGKKCFVLEDSDVLDYTLYPKLKQN